MPGIVYEFRPTDVATSGGARCFDEFVPDSAEYSAESENCRQRNNDLYYVVRIQREV